MAKRTVYIVSQIGWEYNDEYYYRPESEGGKPVIAYSTKEKAQAECDTRNAHLIEEAKDPDNYYKRTAEGREKGDEYGMVNITADFEVVPVELED